MPSDPTLRTLPPTATWMQEPDGELTVWPTGDTRAPPGSAGGHPAGDRLPERYETLDFLGAGGMSVLLRVRDRRLGAELAFKMLDERLIGDARNRALFLAEAQVTAQLQHPGIVAVQDVGELDDGRLWFTMDIVRGETLGELCTEASGRRSLEAGGVGWTRRRLIGAVQQVAETIAYAHSTGAVHRDLKPSNIMVGAFGEVRVMDWGLATHPDVPHPLAGPGVVLGTPAYMAPEQARGQVATPASDVFGLGGILLRVLTNRHPREGQPRALLAQAAAGRTPTRLKDLDAPEALATLCRDCLHSEPADRPSAREVATALSDWLEGARRRQEALAMVAQARQERPRLGALREQAAELRAQATALLDAVPPEAPIEAKHPGWALQDRADALLSEALLGEVTWTQHLRAALERSPELPEAHALLAEHYRDQLVQAEARRQPEAAARAEALLANHDRGEHAAFLRGTGAISLRTSRPVHVRLHRIVEQERRLVPVFERELGLTPLARVPVERGSWLLTLHTDDGVDVRYPVFLEREQHWDGVRPGSTQPWPIWIPRPDDLTQEEVYIPAGWCIVGGEREATDPLPRQRVWVDGFVMQRFPVTWSAWRDWLQERLDAGDEEAVRACWPWRNADEQERWLVRRGFRVELADPSQARHPVCAVPWSVAARYAASLGGRLPLSLEFEKAGRGVDGRSTPWGQHLESRWSRIGPSHPQPAGPVSVDAVPQDVSVYGVRGLAGNMRTWCANWWSREGPVDALARVTDRPAEGTHRANRGGAWSGSLPQQRLADRFGDRPESRFVSLGLRWVRGLPG